MRPSLLFSATSSPYFALFLPLSIPYLPQDNFKSRVSGYTGYLPKAALNQTVDVDKVRGVEAFSEYDHNSGAIAGYYVAVSSPGGAYDATKKRA